MEGGSREERDAQREVEAGVEEIGDPETGPTLPSAALVAHAAVGTRAARAEATPTPARAGTGREIWRLAWPVMLSQMLITMVQLVDIAMVGRIGPQAQAAVGYAGQFFNLAQAALFAIGFACVAVMARAIGAGAPARARSALAGSLVLAFLVSLAFAAGILSAPHAVLRWLSASPDVIELAIPYLQLVMAGSVLLSVAITLESALRANRDTKTPMRVAVVVTGVKLALNALLIFGAFGFPRLELVGAGLATVASQLTGVGLLCWVVARQPRSSPLALRRGDLRRARPLLRELARISGPGVAERLVMNVALLSYFGVLGQFGTAAVAAYTVGVRILAFSWIPGTAYAQAVATLIGQALGAGDRDGATRAGWRAAKLALATAVVLGLVCAFARDPLSRLFTDDEATIAALGPFMLCLAIAQPFLQVHFTLGGAHRGAGDTWTPLVAAFVGNWVFRVPLSFFAAEVAGAGLVAVWAVLILDHVARAAWLFLSFRRGRWQDGGRRRAPAWGALGRSSEKAPTRRPYPRAILARGAVRRSRAGTGGSPRRRPALRGGPAPDGVGHPPGAPRGRGAAPALRRAGSERAPRPPRRLSAEWTRTGWRRAARRRAGSPAVPGRCCRSRPAAPRGGRGARSPDPSGTRHPPARAACAPSPGPARPPRAGSSRPGPRRRPGAPAARTRT